MTGLRLTHLCDLPTARDALADWYVREWAPWYGPGGGGDAQADLAACADKQSLPLCLLAHDPTDLLVGTAALKTDSVGGEHGQGPWLAAVLVDPAHRGRGIGTALVAAIEAEAARLGYRDLYSSTDTAGWILERRGWLRIGATESLRGTIDVYRKSLDPAGI